MNRLQRLDEPVDYLVTLNGSCAHRRRHRARAHELHASHLHADVGGRAGAAPRVERRPHRVRRRVPGMGLPRRRLRVRRARRRVARRRRGDRDLRRSARAVRARSRSLVHDRRSSTSGARRSVTRSTTGTRCGSSTSTPCPRCRARSGTLATFEARDHFGDPDATLRAQRRRLSRRARHRPPRRPGPACSPTRGRSATCSTRSPSTGATTRPALRSCVIAEVHNTYGGRHCYLVRPTPAGTPTSTRTSSSRRSSRSTAATRCGSPSPARSWRSASPCAEVRTWSPCSGRSWLVTARWREFAR